METGVNITILGGCKVGKTSIINKLWTNYIKDNVVTEFIKGRGEMSFMIHELDPVVYTYSERWLSNSSNLEILKKTDTLLFIIPSVSFGYQEEFQFLNELYTNKKINPNAKLLIVVSKVDEIYKNTHKIYDTIASVLEIENMIRKTANIFLPEFYSPESIIFTSATNDCNIDTLKENVWDCIVKRSNEIIYNSSLPTLVVSGKRGCGKSSTLNKLFDLDLPTDMAIACTKYPRVMHIECLHNNCVKKFNLVDLPGIAESLSADIGYAEYYEKYLNDASVILALSQADTRAYTQDEIFYKRLISKKILNNNTKILIGLNQVDLLFKSFENPDGIILNDSILSTKILKEKVDDIFKCYQMFDSFGITKDFSVHPYSAFYNWNVDSLKEKLFDLL